jgi:hypothetical protein
MDNRGWTLYFYNGLNALYNKNYDLEDFESLKKLTIARTTNSDDLQKNAYLTAWRAAKARGEPKPRKKDPRWSTPIASLACHIDLSTWFLDQQSKAGWPSINTGMIETAMGDEFIEKYISEGVAPGQPNYRTPFDALNGLSATLLHEVSSRVHGK